MKERIVVDNRIYLNKEDFIEVEDIITDNLTTAKYTKEQVPETWEELKKLCKQTGHYAIEIIKTDGIFYKESINVFSLSFRDNRDIEDNEGSAIVENRTPAQMWAIIKSLIGEE